MKTNYQLILDKTIEELKKNEKVPKLLLHSCCAPCSSYVLEYLSKYFEITIYYYNPNIDTKDEFDLRSREQIKLINDMHKTREINYVIETFDPNEFEEIAKGHEEDKEGGERCTLCYNLRLEKTAKYAKENGFDYFTTTLSISPYKNSQKLNNIGEKLGEKYNVNYLYADFKKNNGYKRSIELSKMYNLYRQDYCGCKYSKIEHERRLERKRALEIKIPTEDGVFKENLDDTLVSTLKKEDLKKDIPSKGEYKEQKVNKKQKKAVKMILFILSLAILVIPSYCMIENAVTMKKYVKYEALRANIDEIYTYGRYFQLNGNLEVGEDYQFDKVSLYFNNDKNSFEIEPIYSFENGVINFKLNDKINEGYILDDMKIGNYELFLKTYFNEEEKYYILENKTNYQTTLYYSMTENDNRKKYTINTEQYYKTLNISVSDTNDDVYDIVLDPGHGGKDPGACNKGICETDYTLNFANELKDMLEEEGYRVKLTREDNNTLATYGYKSRTAIPYETFSKYTFSLHLNAGPKCNGFEIYTPYNVDYKFANMLATNLNEVNDFTYSTNTFNKVSNGIYTRTMSEKELKDDVEAAIKENREPYGYTLFTNYYYMIREVGGYKTGAYVDGRESEDRNNPFVKSNSGSESYIIELGYITNDEDLNYVNNYQTEYLTAIKDSIVTYLND